jgi:hypothetical protein
MSFEANQGQTDNSVKFFSRGRGYDLFLTSTEAVLVLSKKSMVVRMELLETNSVSEPKGVDELPGKANYFVGSDSGRWRTNIPTYAKVRYGEVYPGIDLVYYGNGRRLEYDFNVAPGADPGIIRLGFKGIDEVRIDGRGDLVAKAGGEEIRLLKPVAYQQVGGNRQEIAAEYALLDDQKVTFKVGQYDVREPLVIDPVLSYSTYLGGDSGDGGYGLAVDGSGNAYVTGITSSTNFPTASPLQPAIGGSGDAFVAKLNAAGSALVYSTYLGGNAGDGSEAIAVDASGNAYVTGYTLSTNFPTASPLQAIQGGFHDAFVAKLNTAGSALLYSTYLGGRTTDYGNGIALDASGNAYLTGYTDSTNFPTAHPLQPALGGQIGRDAFVAKLNAAGSALLYSTYLGGDVDDLGWEIAVDSSGNAYVIGYTTSPDFPTKRPLQERCGGCVQSSDAFVAKLNPSGSALVYSTFLGGEYGESGFDIAVDSLGNAYITGDTSSPNFPTVSPLQPALGNSPGTSDAFVAKLNAAGSALLYSTFLGGSYDDRGYGIAVDESGNAHLTGYTSSPNFPTAHALQPAYGGGMNDAFVAKLNAAGSALLYSTFLGGSGDDLGFSIAVDGSGNAYITGGTASTNFPTASPLQPAYGGGPIDTFIAKISDVVPVRPTLTSIRPRWGAPGTNVNVTLAGTHFVLRGTVVTVSGEGVTVGPVNVTGSESLTTTFTIATTAMTGRRSVKVTTGGGTSIEGVAFTIAQGQLFPENN